MKKMLVILLGLALVFAFAACGPTEQPAPAPEGGEEEAPAESAYGDTINYAINTDAQSLDPQVQNDTTSEQICLMLYNTLLRFEEDGSVGPNLAKEWSCSEDGLTWTFVLNEGVKFHNGKELTSADVKATFDRALNAEAGGLRTTEVIKMFTAVEAVDPYTVTITTDAPYGPMEALMCNMFCGIMDSEMIDQYGLELGQKVEAINGTGPYKVVAWNRDSELQVERFDDYFAGASPTQYVNYLIIPEASARLIALETGEVDVIQSPSADDLAAIENNPDLTVLRAPSVGQRLFRFGCDDPIIGNTLVRQAIVYAIDRQSIIDALFAGTGYPSTSCLAPVTWGYTDLGVIEQDQEKAKALLTEAGYPEGFDTKIVTTERYAKGVQLAEVLKSQLAEVGINAEIEVWEWSALAATWDGITAEEFDEPIFIMGAGPSMRDADGGLRGLYTTTETGLNDRNYGFYSNARVDELVMAGMQETDTVKRAELYAEAEQILYLDDPAGFWLFDMYGLVAMSTKVENVTLSAISTVTFENATIAK